LADRMTSKKDPMEKMKVKMISMALKMVEESVPVLVLFQHEGKVKSYGSKNILEVIQDMLIQDDSDINNAVCKDAAKLVETEHCDDPTLVDDKENAEQMRPKRRPKSLLKNSGSVPLLEPLPYPLSIMTFPETIRTLRQSIVHDKVSRTGAGGEVRYGNPAWEPSFWPNHLWEWTDLKQNFKNLTLRDFPCSSQMSMLEFYKLCIKRCLEAQSLDPEAFFSSERTVEELDYRRRSRACRSASRNTLATVENQTCLSENGNLVKVEEEEHTDNLEEVHVDTIELEEYSNVVPLDDTDSDEKVNKKRKLDKLDDVSYPSVRRRFSRNSVICFQI